MRSSPPAYPVSVPSEPMTRWHGRTTGIGFAPFAAPTAREAPRGRPSRAARAPYVVVVVGGCLTYAYDRAAVDCHVFAWQDAEQVNRSVRLPDFTPATATRRHAGEDVSVFCNVHGEQRRSVTSSTGADGRPVLTVTVGAVTVDVHTTTALRSFLAAWRKAATVTGMLESARNDA